MTSALDLAILGLLKEQELHGYELKKQLGELLGPRAPVSFGSLYPALARLEKAGLVKAVEAARSPPLPLPARSRASWPPSGPGHGLTPGGRGKKVYGITETGEAALGEPCSPTPARRRPHLRPAARVLPPPAPAERLASSSAAGPSSPRASTTRRIARRGRARSTATSARSASTTPIRPTTTSPGSTASSPTSAPTSRRRSS